MLALIPTILLIILFLFTQTYSKQTNTDPRGTLKVQYNQIIKTNANDIEKTLMKARMEVRGVNE